MRTDCTWRQKVVIRAIHRRSLAAPPAALRNSRAHGRSPGSRRIAGAAFPDLHRVQWRQKASARRSQSRGRPRIGARLSRVPFSPSSKIEGPCGTFVPASRGVVKSSGDLRGSRGRVLQFDRSIRNRTRRSNGRADEKGSPGRIIRAVACFPPEPSRDCPSPHPAGPPHPRRTPARLSLPACKVGLTCQFRMVR